MMRSSCHLTKFRVLLSRTAVSQLSLLDDRRKSGVKNALATLEDDPFRRRSGTDIKKLVTPGELALFRLRIGDYRAIYFVVDQEVRVTEIIHRSKGYKWLE
jgi:mRNA interferase RelE/StbE